jgi:hypothetical protein
MTQSYSYFEQFSSFIVWAVKRESNSENIDHYLDDFFFAGSGGTNDWQVLLGQYCIPNKSKEPGYIGRSQNANLISDFAQRAFSPKRCTIEMALSNGEYWTVDRWLYIRV